MEKRQVLLWFFGAMLSACSAAPQKPAPPASRASTATAVAAAPPTTAPPPRELACSPDARTPTGGHRAAGLERVVAKKYRQALSELELALDEKPSDIGAFSLHAIAEAEVAAHALPIRAPPATVHGPGEPAGRAAAAGAARGMVVTLARSLPTADGPACHTVLHVTVDAQGAIRRLAVSR